MIPKPSPSQRTPAAAKQEGQVHGALPPNKLSARDALARLAADKDPFWMKARESTYRSLRELDDQELAARAKGLKVPVLRHGPMQEKVVALTFDDGPHADFTPQLLDVLKRLDLKATFFVVGEMAEAQPELVRMELAAGHTVANHTYHHVSLPKIPIWYVADEIRACGEVVKAITGRAPRYFRPPGGDYNRDIAEFANALGYTVVLWTDDPGDYLKMSADRLVSRTLQRLGPGCILLLHDGAKETLTALPSLVAAIRARGYRFVTLDEMVGIEPKTSGRK